MGRNSDLQRIYAPSSDVVARDIEGELIIVPISAGIADLDEELYTLNDTGRAVWRRLDGRRTLEEVVALLVADFDAPPGVIEADVLGLVAELARRRILVALPNA